MGVASPSDGSDGADRGAIYSVGHSNQSLESFLALLTRHGVEALVDVRSAPYSRYVPHFNRPELQAAATRARIRYAFMGEELGGRPAGDEYYDDRGHVLYSRVAASPFFQSGLDRLLEEGRVYRTAIMCGEEDPTHCHRHLLIARVLRERGVNVLHIRGDDREQPEDELRPPPTLWDAVTTAEDAEATWKSRRPVARPGGRPGAAGRSGEWDADDG